MTEQCILQIKARRRVRHYELRGPQRRVAFFLKETAGMQENLRNALAEKNEVVEAVAEASLASIAKTAGVAFKRVPVRRKAKQPA